MEAALIEAFERAGARRVAIAEHGYKDAWVWGLWQGSEIFGHVYRIRQAELRASPSRVVREDLVEGVPMKYAASGTQGAMRIFTCRKLIYELSVEPSDEEVLDGFLPRFLDAVGCPRH